MNGNMDSKLKLKKEGFGSLSFIIFGVLTLLTLILCVCVGSVNIPVSDVFTAIYNTIFSLPMPEGIAQSIIVSVRLPRVLSVALVGISLSICGAAMQGLLKNPLAEGSTLGVASGASLGAVIAIAFGITIPNIPLAGTMIMALIFAFVSLVLILSLSYRLDFSLSTNTIILIGVIFSMFVNSLISLVISLAADKVKHITFWTMGSLAGSTYTNVIILFSVLLIFGGIILRFSTELNAFAIGEDNARNIGVNIKRVKFLILFSVAAIIGVCVSIGGTIGFVGLVVPHITRMLVGSNHKKLFPATIFTGAIFLMLSDLVARAILSPLELPIGVVTSFIGAIVFVAIFYRNRKKS